MRHLRWCAALGLAAWGGLAAALASDPTGTPARPGPPVAPKPLSDFFQPPKAAACGNHATAVEFVDSPREAAAQAKKEQKLVFVLHLSGIFEDPRFT
jgi:hypothetical protein